MTTIDALVAAFGALPGTGSGTGPRHPVTPDPALEPLLAALFDTYPGLTGDTGYTEFLWKYAGLSRSDEAQNQLFDISGFASDSRAGPPAVVDFRELYGPAVDEDGFFVFAEATVHADTPRHLDTYEHDFAFALDGDREPGVHVFRSTLNARAAEWVRYTDDFTTFLAAAVEHRGVWPRR
ncbi:hypothetical protein ACWCPQ_11205 [Nocardia sp. NPDC001965]